MRQTVHFDLNNSGEFCDGELCFDGASVTAAAEGKTLFSSGLEGVEKLTLRTYVGCGTLEAEPFGNDEMGSRSVIICRFSMNRVEEIGEFC